MKQQIDETKRMQQLAGILNENQNVDEGIGTALKALPLAAALTFGSPKDTAAQVPQGIENVTQVKLSDEEAGDKLWHVYDAHRSTVDVEQFSPELINALVKADKEAGESGYPYESVKNLGHKAKKDPAAIKLINTDENALRAASKRGYEDSLEEVVNEALTTYRKKKLKEANEQTDPVAEKDAEQGLKQALAILKSGEGTIKPSPQDGKVDEAAALALGLIAGAPGLISLLGKSVNAVSGLFQKDNKQGTTVGNALKHFGHKLEGYYLGAIGDILKKAFPKTYGQQDVTDHNSDLYKTAHAIYAAILAAAAISSGLGAAQAHSITAANLEGGLSVFKSSEVIGLAQKIASATQA
jgi:hypothetical protein